jgi:folate-binding protein YgfZ
MMSAQLFQLLKNRVTALPIDESGVFRISGPDAVRYLHNRLTQDIKKLTPGSGARSLVLTPNGKVQGLVTVLRREQDLILYGPQLAGERGEEFLRAVLQFKVADQIEVETLSPRYAVGLLLGQGAAQQVGMSAPQPNSFIERGEELFVFQPRLGVECVEVLSTNRFAPAAEGLAFDTVRILAGEPLYGVDVTERTSVAELPLERFVSFQKGCYAGQEVVEMSTARGKPPRRFVVLRSNAVLQPGESILSEGVSVGTVTSVARLAEGSVALGFLKNQPLSQLQTERGEGIQEETTPLTV